jgi:L-lactate dehydrogenase complex protein LldF
MTAAVRRTLRQRFFEAEAGITGVNFGVAETGTLCLVTNEGNGRMVTCLPPLHIAVMGIERRWRRWRPERDVEVRPVGDGPGTTPGRCCMGRAALAIPTAVRTTPVLVDNGGARCDRLVEVLACVRRGACLNAVCLPGGVCA